jgi:hypothetical protein
MRAAIRWFAIPLLAGSLPAVAQPAPVIDNERVTVWDIKLTKGEAGPATPNDQDTVIMFLEGGDIRTLSKDGKASTATRQFGDAVFVPRGTDATDTLVSDGRAHEIVVALKDHREPAIPNTTGLPAAFPRPGSAKALDNDRVVVWRCSGARASSRSTDGGPGADGPGLFRHQDSACGDSRRERDARVAQARRRKSAPGQHCQESARHRVSGP